MAKRRFHGSRVTLLPAVVLSMVIIVSLMGQVWADEPQPKPYVGLRPPAPTSPLVSITEEQPFRGLNLQGFTSPPLKRSVPGIRREIKVDSTGQNINFYENYDKIPVALPNYLPLRSYAEMRQQNSLTSLWQRNALSRLGESATGGGSGALRIDIPVEIKSKAFQKIFGGGTVGLDVTGDIGIKGGLRHEKRSEVKTTLNQSPNTNFKMEQTQRFKVQGHIGDKVTIGVDQDSDRTFDFENSLQLKYTGYEDEIIQSIEAGNIALSLPGTRYVTFGGQSAGLFGVKTAMRLGNLSLTAIASQEKGEKKQLSLKGGASEGVKEIQDYDYLEGYYYFIDDYYRKQFPVRGSNGEFLVDPGRRITRIEVYKSNYNYNRTSGESVINGWAWVPAKADSGELVITEGDTSYQSSENYRGPFIRQEKTEYYFDPELGYLRMNQPLDDSEVLAVAFRDTSGYTRGNIDFNPDNDKVVQLRLLKPMSPRPSNKSWNLAWRNVYMIGPKNMSDDGFELRLLFKPASGDPQETITVNGKAITYLQVFGLDRVNKNGDSTPDNIIDRNDNILRLGQGELWLPSLRPFDPKEADFMALLPPEKRSPAIYDTTVQQVINGQSKFYFEVKSKTRSAEYSLGMNVIENSEEVILNGRKLTRGTDYIIEYFTGSLKMLNQEALQPSANVEISYESNQIFQIDKKTVMGARASYDLWDDSFIGATMLYLNESTLDQKVRVGKGPMRNLVWDVNTAMTFKPFFMTRFANLLPFVDTRDATNLKFEGEVAQVIPNPNTRNNDNTGDHDGVAYIDDFEAAKRTTPLGISRKSWRPAAPPVGKVDPRLVYPTLEARGDLRWYEPYGQVAIKEIWPNRDVNGSVAQTVSVLIMEFHPADSLADVRQSWGGLQKGLSSGYYDQTESKFIEVWVKAASGTMHIDLGQISEDYIPNGKYDSEDKMRNGFRNNLLDEGEDIGVDGMSNSDPRAIAAGGDFWDVNGNGVRDFGEPYSNDDWSYSAGSNNYDKINGTEANRNDAGGGTPDSEDMNTNMALDVNNEYFSYSFSLERDSPDTTWIAGASINKETGQDNGWRLYRIPLDAPSPTLTKVGNPDITRIEFIRLWVDGFKEATPHYVWIAELDLVGSEWKELGTASALDPETFNSAADSIVTISVVNTHDNPDYVAPPGVTGEQDRITGVIAREQALVMNITNLQPGETGAIQKVLYEKQDYIHYNTLKMFTYGYDPVGTHIRDDSSKVEFFLRFGADVNNYYEVRQPVYDGWDKRNNIEINLLDLSAVKLIAENYDSTANRKGYYLDVGGGKSWFIKGIPALTNIKMLTAGVRNLDPLHPFTGQVYMNELRLSNVKKDKGMAYRARLEMNWAGLVNFNGEVEKQDADFHNVATQYGEGNNSVSGSFSTSVQVDKFLPAKLGLSIPVSYNYSHSESTPKYKPGTDVEVTDALPDSILDAIRTVTQRQGYSVSLGVNSRSKNFIVKNVLNRLRTSYSESRDEGSNSTMKSTSNQTQNADLSWDVTFSPNNYFRPFKWLGDAKWLIKLADMKLFFTPQNFSSRISGTKTRSLSLTRTGVETNTGSYAVNSSIGGSMKIFESLSFDLNRTYANDLYGIPSDSLRMMWKRGELGYLTNMNQNFKISYNPKLFNWLTNNFSYSAGFRYGFNRQQKLQARNAQLAKTLGLNGSLDLETLWNSVYKPKGGAMAGGRRPTAPQTRRPVPGKDQNAGQGEKKDKEKEKKAPKEGGSGFSVMGLFGHFFGFFEPFSVTYNKRENLTTYGITRMPGMRFMLGLQDSLGVPMETSTGASSSSVNRNSSSTNDNVHVSSGFGISRNIKVTLNYDNTTSLNRSTTTTGQRSHSRLVYGDKLDMPFPQWSLRISGLEKLPLIKKYIQTVSLDHGYSGQFDQTYNFENGKEVITKEDRSAKFSPLAGMSLSFKNGMTMSVRYTQSENTSLSSGYSVGGTRTNVKDLSVSAQYRKQSNFRIPIPVWPFKNMRLKNSVNLQVTVSSSANTTRKSRARGDYEITAETSKWLFKPDLQYSFSERVNGGAFLELGKTHNKLIGDTSYYEFGINVNISIRGR
ncbi:MAG TPA: cell surface protein SprA [bacterium]|nr:cell surface protein SprA [bacterium]HPR87490.1 cell surface protein SprA [bacterium]